MNKPISVFHCSLSRNGSPAANAIQTRHMSNAFAQWAERVCLVVREGEKGNNDHTGAPNLELRVLPSGSWRVSAWLYSVRAFILYRKMSQHEHFNLVFTRSLIFCLLVSLVRREALALELHTGVRGFIDRVIFRLLRLRGVHFICITNSIAQEIRAELEGYKRIHIAPDGHGFPVIAESDVGPTPRMPMRVGYFGSLTRQKGLAILQELIDVANDFEFYVFSKEVSALRRSPALKAYEYLKPQDVFDKMLEMDVFLLTVEPQGESDRISGYTSPLKLYEYLAAGRPIVASDLAVLREDAGGDVVLFCKNTADGFIRALYKVSSDRDDARRMAVRGLSLAKERTWTLRAKKIIDACGL